jgi:translation initiation factor 1A
MVIKKGGKKGKKMKSNNESETNRELVYKDIEQFQEYAQVVKILGNCRCELYCFDGITRLGHIRGNMRKKVWIKTGDIILVSLREYEKSKCDIIYLYKANEVKSLKSYGELPDNVKINENETEKDDEDIGVDFEDEDDEENKEKAKKDFQQNFEENFNNI